MKPNIELSGREKKEFFNERAETWIDTFYTESGTGEGGKFEAEFERLFSLLAIGSGDCVLDVGCGSGVLAPYILAGMGPDGRLYELDYAENMIAVNKRLHGDRRITFLAEDVINLPLPDGLCDIVICFSCFPHLDDKPEAMRQMTRVLKENGKLAIAHFLSSAELNDHHRKAPAVMHDRMPGPDEMESLFAGAGLSMACFIDNSGFYLALGRKSSGLSAGALN